MQDNVEVIETENVVSVEIEETKPSYKVNRNTLGKLYKSRERVIVPHGTTYNVGRNKAKREARGK
jgi:hypothetical protein